MGELKTQQSQHNVNVTLSSSGRRGEWEEKEFPCPLCGGGLPIRASKRYKPYFICDTCGVQVFVRGRTGIARLNEMANAGILISGKVEGASYGIKLYNRLEILKLQKRDLERKRGVFSRDENLEHTISLVEREIGEKQALLAQIAQEGKPAKEE